VPIIQAEGRDCTRKGDDQSSDVRVSLQRRPEIAELQLPLNGQIAASRCPFSCLADNHPEDPASSLASGKGVTPGGAAPGRKERNHAACELRLRPAEPALPWQCAAASTRPRHLRKKLFTFELKVAHSFHRTLINQISGHPGGSPSVP